MRESCTACGGLGFHRATTADDFEETEPCTTCNKKGKLWLYFVGVAQSNEELQSMLILANNGHRRVHAVSKQTAAGIWYGVYVS